MTLICILIIDCSVDNSHFLRRNIKIFSGGKLYMKAAVYQDIGKMRGCIDGLVMAQRIYIK